MPRNHFQFQLTMSALTSRERLHRCFFHRETDRPAVHIRGALTVSAKDETYKELGRLVRERTDLVDGWNAAQQLIEPLPIVEKRKPYNQDFDLLTYVLRTPRSDLEGQHLVGLHGQPGMMTSYFLKDAEDAAKYLSLPMPQIGGDYSGFQAQEKQMGDRGIILIGIGWNPAAKAVRLFGSEQFAVMSITDRDLLQAIMRRECVITCQLVKYLCHNGLGPYFAMFGEEYLVPPLHGPKDFYDFNVKYDKPIVDLIHQAGGRIHIHSHGRIRQVFQGFLDFGADVLHPIEGPPMGDITMAEAKALAQNRLCLEGNIQIARLYEASPDEIRKETESIIQDAFADHRGLIVAPTASPFITGQGHVGLPQYQAMIETVLAWKSS